MGSYCLMRTVLRFGVAGRLLGIVGILGTAAEMAPYKWFKQLMLSVTITLTNVEKKKKQYRDLLFSPLQNHVLLLALDSLDP